MNRIVNAAELALTPQRRAALEILEAGLEAIDTASVIRRSVSLSGDTLTVGDASFQIGGRLFVLGFGKASCQAAAALEGILGERIAAGMVIGSSPAVCETITAVTGTHPMPSPDNVGHSGKLMELCRDLREDDVVIVLVSGGGSALLCWPMDECDQGARLYEAARHADLTIRELNTVRKHLSELKGGGLAKALWPARVVGLIFSDVPGDAPELVASGPTYPDATTAADAQAIADCYGLGTFAFRETPKEERYFSRVENMVIVSSAQAAQAMADAAGKAGYEAFVAGTDWYVSPADAVQRLRAGPARATALIAAGEFRLPVPKNAGTGGRNGYAALTALSLLGSGELFAAIASDGIDNTPAAGAIADALTREHVATKGLDLAAALARFDDGPFFDASGDHLFTGPTGANVSDLMLLLKGSPSR